MYLLVVFIGKERVGMERGDRERGDREMLLMPK